MREAPARESTSDKCDEQSLGYDAARENMNGDTEGRTPGLGRRIAAMSHLRSMVRDERRVVQAGTPATAARTHAQLHVAALICGGNAGHVDVTAAAVPVYFQPEQSQKEESGREENNTPAKRYKAKRHIADNLRQMNAKKRCTHGLETKHGSVVLV